MESLPRQPATGFLRNLLSQIAMPTDDWARQGEDRRRLPTLMVLMSLLLGLIIAAAVLAADLLRTWPGHSARGSALLAVLGAASLLMGVLMYHVHRHLLGPLAKLYAWALQMCDGDLSARIPAGQQGRFAKLSFHVNRLSEALDKLANEMDDMVWHQTRSLEQKNLSLELLYQIASTVGAPGSLEDTLQQSMHKLAALLNARTARVHVEATDHAQPLARALNIVANGPDSDYKPPDRAPGEPVTTVLRHQGRILGRLEFCPSANTTLAGNDVSRLLDNVGSHLAMAVVKSRLDQESQNLCLMQERNALAHELHDSLAQTLVSVKLQTAMLAETLAPLDAPQARREVHRVQDYLEEANNELRELIGNFRAPADQRGLLPALQGLAAELQQSTDMAVHLHTQCEHLELSPEGEIQILRIAREALYNCVRHARARTVRVHIKAKALAKGRWQMLIEDDGLGFHEPERSARPGEHLGLAIMQERAGRIGADLHIESEPGEGTRVVLDFDTRCAPQPPAEPTDSTNPPSAPQAPASTEALGNAK